MALKGKIDHRKNNERDLRTVEQGIKEAKRYTGVDYYPKLLGFVVQFRHNGRREYFGPFKSAKEAGDEYDRMHAALGNNKAPSDKLHDVEDPDEEFPWL